MTEALQVALIAATPPSVLAAASLLASLKNKKAIQEVHLSVNSRLTQLLEAVGKAAHAEGMAEGREQTTQSEQPMLPKEGMLLRIQEEKK
jgi:hypothetical protein